MHQRVRQVFGIPFRQVIPVPPDPRHTEQLLPFGNPGTRDSGYFPEAFADGTGYREVQSCVVIGVMNGCLSSWAKNGPKSTHRVSVDRDIA